MRYGQNRFRNRYDYESRRSYKRQRNSDDDSDISSIHNSANNDLLKEFINIKKSKEKNQNNVENKQSNLIIPEKSFNNNNLIDFQDSIKEKMEQPFQIFSALKKPNLN